MNQIFFATLAAIILLAGDAGGATVKNPKQNPRDAISGLWYTEGREGGVELYQCGEEICGRLQWLGDDNPESISRDPHNPDPDLRQRPLCHMQFMGGFEPDGKGRYADGWIYNPRNGGTYSAEMTLVDHDTLDLRGYLFFPFLGESQTWKRAKIMHSCTVGG